MKTICKLLIIVLPLLFFAACATVTDNGKILETKDKNYIFPQDGGIAIIAANKSMLNIEIVKQITNELINRKKMNPITQDEVKIKLGYESAEYEAYENFTDQNVLKVINELHKKINTKYIYLINAGTFHSGSISSYNTFNGTSSTVGYMDIPVDGFMVEYPSGEIVARTEAVIQLEGSNDEYIKKGINNIAVLITNEIVKRAQNR